MADKKQVFQTTKIITSKNHLNQIRTYSFVYFFQILSIILNSALFVMSLYDMLFARREGGDPTTAAMPVEPTTYGNPGFRDRGTNGESNV